MSCRNEGEVVGVWRSVNCEAGSVGFVMHLSIALSQHLAGVIVP